MDHKEKPILVFEKGKVYFSQDTFQVHIQEGDGYVAYYTPESLKKILDDFDPERLLTEPLVAALLAYKIQECRND